METVEKYVRLTELYRPCLHLDSALFALNWDLEVLMPDKASQARGELVAWLEGEKHRRLTSPEMERALGEAEAATGHPGCSPGLKADIREIRRQVDRANKLPASLVSELANLTAVAQKVWAEAREKSEFGLFLPKLSRIIELKRQEAEAIGYRDSPYDALLDEFEPQATAAKVGPLLASLEGSLSRLVKRIVNARFQPHPFKLKASREAQERLCRSIAAKLGFDFKAGRLDASVHPFTERLHGFDTRITTRYDKDDLCGSLYSTIHEVGHALYEQGLDQSYFGLARGLYCSMGVHESQSRLWENIVGRSEPFCRFLLEEMDRAGIDCLGLSPEDLYGALNIVTPSFIRTEADEVTYNLHVCLRFKLEHALIRGNLAAADLPSAWNDQMEELLGITPPSDREGVLQDVHWSCGLFGYFPTYTLGNLMSAQLYRAAELEIGPQGPNFEAGDFQPLLSWLRSQVHQQGRIHSASQLMKSVTGEPPSDRFFLEYLGDKYNDLYGL